MAHPRTVKSRGQAPAKSDFNEARPLLQAIFLGLLLAGGLMAAAAMATPQGQHAQQILTEKSSQPSGQQMRASPGMHQPY
ncbi:hypothetical protein CLV41_108151 [Roseibium marinum]|uniref:Uncharacterized protein n=2 Tax=Roseibium marinum TaxID=281252 RepID=A0A2S3UPW1_9HYPH|nr:hypothetical protein CLV41_108151 [Roseibium marinum]